MPRKSKKRSRSSQESADKVSATASKTTGTRPAAADARASTESIEKTVVGHGSFKAYLSQITRFVIFIFDNYQQYLTQPHLAAMEEADKKDKETNNNDRTALRNAIIHAVDAIKPQRSGSDHNCFLKIDGDGNLPIDIVLEYMGTKFNYVEVDRSSAIAYLKELKLSTDISPEMEVGNDKVRLKVFQSYEQYSGIRSAVLWIYKLAKVKSPFQSDLASYLIEDYARERNVWEEPKDWTAAKVTRMWDAISEDFTTAFCQTNRNHELTWSTVYSRMSDANVFSDRRKKLKMQKRVDANTV